mmetsp:Transcript_36047/g.52833  ORF Transcript_36047/g.52833 Transcript_36047/m.52833 type:complete len:285 (+) Transcript_36047:116-970(+)|eukprot:CAMPEP_0195523988 /NCGR_PEP_ID=MMETSP0794_2-20130614/23543_1 /TAXON_ID=515487 /ORGANISM="Stephanopyxis turris, Strain CCMP 815" /LENGTH=284 /DNA_ID=CAMNT_0040654113 /DNA_START=85 /DNA_END=939 /DNA_ORIENTATION=+
MMNYHELTMGQPRNSPAARKQMLVLCTLGFGVALHAAINAGIFHPVSISQGSFDGGEFVYKTLARDYSTSMGLLRRVADDLSIDWSSGENDDLLFSLYMDEESKVPAGSTRHLGGVIFPSSSKNKSQYQRLVKDDAEKAKITTDMGGVQMEIAKLKYEIGSLPKENKAAVAQFPFTNGFISILIHSYKVFPAMIKYAKEHGEKGNSPVMLTTCSIKQQMCTHYAPLTKGTKYMLKQDDTETYARKVLEQKAANNDGVSMANILKGLKKLSPFSKKDVKSTSEEL